MVSLDQHIMCRYNQEVRTSQRRNTDGKHLLVLDLCGRHQVEKTSATEEDWTLYLRLARKRRGDETCMLCSADE
jgi:hypothetical protein